MTIKLKKIFAREFLLALMLVTIGLISFVVLYSYTSYLDNKIRNLTTLIVDKTRISDSLSNHYYLYKNASVAYDEYGIPIKTYKINKHLNNDDLGNIDEWTKYIAGKIIYPPTHIDSINYQKSLEITNEIKLLGIKKANYIDKILSKTYQTTITLRIVFLSFLLLFIFRYLFYGIKLSIKILKTK